MSYYISVLQDFPSGLWKLNESFGSIAYDSSGCGNNGSYYGDILNTSMPIVSGGTSATKITSTNYLEFNITKDFSGMDGIGGFGTNKTSDNDFSLEIWFHPKNLTTLTPILADSGGVGIYWDNGNIVFTSEFRIVDSQPPLKLEFPRCHCDRRRCCRHVLRRSAGAARKAGFVT